MSYGTARRKGGFGYYNIGGQLMYFDKKPTERDIQKMLERVDPETEAATFARIFCGGACCADQPRTIN